MADKIILADTSILIDYFRKTDKINSRLIALFDQGYDFRFQPLHITRFILERPQDQLPFWTSVLARTKVLPLDQIVSQTAVDINYSLKQRRKQIGMADLFIAATAIAQNLYLATLNTRHFDRIDTLTLIE